MFNIPPDLMKPRRDFAEPASARHLMLGAVVALGLTLVAYAPVLRGEFVWDDRLIVQQNPLVTGEFTWRSLWLQTDFPLSLLALWLQWLAWGDQPAGYHVVNVLLHAMNVWLVWRVLARLRLPGAALAAALFAVHPVAVASVAWISELKNTLSLAFALLTVWFWLRAEDEPAVAERRRRRGWLGLALAAFTLALLTKTSVVLLPVVLGLLTWWRILGGLDGHKVKPSGPSSASLNSSMNPEAPHSQPQIAGVAESAVNLVTSGEPGNQGPGNEEFETAVTGRKGLKAALLKLIPFFVLALGFGWLTWWFQTHQALGGRGVQEENLAARLALAGQAWWFYLGTALWPFDLNLIYPRWTVDARQLAAYLPATAALAVLAVTWCWRQDWGRHPGVALGAFTALLLPVLGFFDMAFLTNSRVSDHFNYASLIPVLALVAASLARGVHVKVLRVAAPALVLLFGTLTFQRAQVFATDEGLWRAVLARNPTAWAAHNNLACILAERNELAAAMNHFAASLALHPENTKARANYARGLVLLGRSAEAEAQFQAALQSRPDDPDVLQQYAQFLADQDRVREAIEYQRRALGRRPHPDARLQLAMWLRQTGQVADAVRELRTVVTERPTQVEALGNLAWLLATSADAQVRNGANAVRYAERAVALTQRQDARSLGILAAAHAEAGDFTKAVAAAQQAVDLASARGDSQFAAANAQLLRLYRLGRPYREK